jgi:trans-2,3-dihydro-3-hydroxyanthranilate isomerase
MPGSIGFHHVDVFTPRPYSGNSLAVFPDAAGLTGSQMDRITKELRHFESIFLERDGSERGCRARVFDLNEELDFAGHPVIGAAAVLHALHCPEETEGWTIHLKARTVTVETRRRGPGHYEAVLDQGAAEFLATPPREMAEEIASWFSLSTADLDPELTSEVVSTGLRYLVLPVRSEALAKARISRTDLDAKLGGLGAQFAYLLDARTLEARHWNNDGIVEDVATGSGAGCAAAYLRCHGLIPDGEAATLRQGRFTGRPSEIILRAHGAGTDIRSVEVGGDVALVGEGRLDVLPECSQTIQRKGDA